VLSTPLFKRVFKRRLGAPNAPNTLSIVGIVSIVSFSLTPLIVSAAPRALSAELKPAISPPERAWVDFRAPITQPSLSFSEEAMRDPKQLLALIKARPEALNVKQMPNVALALEVAQLLLFNGEPAKGVSVLEQARERWPEDPNVIFAWARAMISLGTPSYGRYPLEKLLKLSNPEAPHTNYTRYLLALCLFLEGESEPAKLRQSLTLLNEVLRRDPNYVGPDGMSADKLRAFSSDLQRRIDELSAQRAGTH
jgi:hypothetical protein